MIQTVIERVRRMENYFDVLQNVLNEDPDALREDASMKAILWILKRYYDSGQWLQDYELDEKGLLPDGLKRGVLAQDTLYDFFDRIKDIDGRE